MASDEKCVYSACPGWGDHDYCVLKTIVKDGKIDHTEKVQYTGVEADEGHICAKGLMSWRQVYSKERLLHPLKRVGERGSGEWEEISWDQALDEIAEKLNEIIEKYGPESVVVWNLTASHPPSMGLLSDMAKRFANIIGTTNPIVAQGLDNGSQFSLEVDLGLGAPSYLYTDPAWMNSSDLVLVWGANPVENQQRVTSAIVEARSRGAKVYDIGLVYDATAGFSDWFIPVKPGSDAALALAICKLIIDNEAYNREFLIDKTVAPLLINTETKMYCRGEDNCYLAWDAAKGEAVPIARAEAGQHFDSLALDGTYEIDGVECKTAFQMLVEHLECYTPEFQESVTGVPAEDCIKLAEQIGKAKAIFYDIAYGMRYRNQGEIHRAVTLMAALTGSFGYEGAGVGYSMVTSSWPMPFNNASIQEPPAAAEAGKLPGQNHVRMNDFFREVKTGKYKAFLKFQGNPVHNNPNRARWEKDTIPNMELVVDYDVWMTDTSELADYVLPDCMPFERMDYVNFGAYGHVVLQEPAVEPMGDNKPPVYFTSELAKRMGLGEFFQKDEEGYIAEILSNSPGLVNDDGTPITIEQLHEQKMVRPASTPKTRFNASIAHPVFGTASGRLEFYSEYYAGVDEAMAKYRPALNFPIEEGSKYPYQFFTGRQRFFMQSMFTEDPVMRELSGGRPLVRMNPVDAERESFVAGDKIEVYNDSGHAIMNLVLDEACPPGTVHVWFGWRQREYEEGSYSELTVPCGGDEATDDLAMLWYGIHMKTTGGKVSAFTALSCTWDTLWDAVCAVRKVEE